MDGPFRHRDALAAGLTPRQLRSPAYVRLLPGVYLPAALARDPRAVAQAVLLVAGQHAFVSHHEAARLWGGVVPASEVYHASAPAARHRSRRSELCVHQSTRTPTHFRGVRVTGPDDTFVDLAAHLSFVDLVVLGDSLVRRERTTPERLMAAAEQAPSRLRRRAEDAASHVRARVDSPMETRSRLLLVLAGLPEPEVDLHFTDARGRVVRRLDLGYEALRIAIEYDGRHHAEARAQWEADIARREEFDAEGWRIITLVANDIYRTPHLTLDRVVRALRSRGEAVSVTSDAWRRHFPTAITLT